MSKISDLYEALISTLENTSSITKAFTGFKSTISKDHYPAAQIALYDGRCKADANHEVEVTGKLVIQIEGASVDSTSTALEEVLTHFFSYPNEAALNAVGVVNIYPTNIEPPMFLETASKYIGSIYLDIQFRYNY